MSLVDKLTPQALAKNFTTGVDYMRDKAKAVWDTVTAENPEAASIFGGSATVSALTIYDPQVIPDHYAVVISQAEIPGDRAAVVVRAHLPEEIQVDTQSEYDTPFAEGLIPHRKIQLMSQLAGWSPTVQAMTAHFWKGSSPIDIQLQLTLIAFKGGNEITEQILRLKVMQMPSTDGATGFLRAPGPKLKLNLDVAKKIVNTTTTAASQAVGTVTGGLIGQDTAQGDQPDSDRLLAIAQTFGQDFATSAQKLIEVEGKISIRIGKFLHFSDVVIRGVSDAYNVTIGPDGLPHKCQVTVQATTRMTPTTADLAEIYCVSPNALDFLLPMVGKQEPTGVNATDRKKVG